MKVIDFHSISALNITPTQSLEWVSHMLLEKYNCELPAKISIDVPGNVFMNTMPSYVPELNRLGVKIVSRYPQRFPALLSEILLYDSITGRTLALMDGTWITAMRTGAVAALSISTLQSSTAMCYAFMGLGNTARSTLLCLLELLNGRDAEIRLLAYKGQEKDFILRFKDYANLHFVICRDTTSLITGADVVVSCITVANGQIAPDSCFRPGVLVVPIHTRGFQNCDLFFDKVFADDTGHVKQFKYFDRFRQFNELSKVLLKQAPGRESVSERILAYNIGISLHDVYFASKIYDMIKGEVPEISLCSNKNKFWL